MMLVVVSNITTCNRILYVMYGNARHNLLSESYHHIRTVQALTIRVHIHTLIVFQGLMVILVCCMAVHQLKAVQQVVRLVRIRTPLLLIVQAMEMHIITCRLMCQFIYLNVQPNLCRRTCAAQPFCKQFKHKSHWPFWRYYASGRSKLCKWCFQLGWYTRKSLVVKRFYGRHVLLQHKR